MFQLDYVSSTADAASKAGKGIANIRNFIFTIPGVGPWWRSMIDGDIMHVSKSIYYYMLEGVTTNADLYQPMDCDSPNLVATRNQCWSGQKAAYDCKPDDLERVLPTYTKSINVGVPCDKAKEPYSWEAQPKTQGSSRSIASVLTFLFLMTAV